MIPVLVTGAGGFIGRNLCAALRRLPDVEVVEYDVGTPRSVLEGALPRARVVYHLAGINRPVDPSEFETGNHGFTKELLGMIASAGARPRVVATSSTQAELDNPYGKSKLAAEDELRAAARDLGLEVLIYRLTNVFGKWCRPFYNSVIATFCYQTAHGEALRVDDPAKEIDFIYVDDVVREFLSCLREEAPDSGGRAWRSVEPAYRRSLADIVSLLEGFCESRRTASLPDFRDLFSKYLYSTYLSYLEPEAFIYAADKKVDERGYLFELLKNPGFGQIFVSRTKPGVTRGNHYHHTKVEKFCVIEGSARVAFRDLNTQRTICFDVTGQECRIIDIPPGWTHNITNTGDGELLTLFWANEPFDAERPDTFFEKV